jgi:hypothetical protein
MIVTSEDSIGLELGFWRDEIWAQNDNPLFTHAEGVSFDTTGSLIRYDLTVLNSGYTLFADGSPILSNFLRDYTAFSNPLFDFPYKTPSFLFFGDDTSSASATINLASISVTTSVAVPEPGMFLMMAMSVLALAVAKRRNWL